MNTFSVHQINNNLEHDVNKYLSNQLQPLLLLDIDEFLIQCTYISFDKNPESVNSINSTYCQGAVSH